MKKVINITLGGIVFSIEQDAYDALSVYFDSIKERLQLSDDYKEVSEDIETAIAEKFIARKKSENMAVVMSDVEAVTKEMGSPADFGDGNEDVSGSSVPSNEASDSAKKRLYRDTENSIIAGVASGLARYFDIDPVIVRLIFVVSIFFNGLGILAYIILWLVVPAAETTAEKFAMRGERVTLKEIKDQVKKNLNTETNLEVTKGAWYKVRGVLVKMFEVIGFCVKALVRLFRYVIGVGLVLLGSLGIAGLVSVYSVILLSDKVFFPAEMQIALEVLTNNALGIVSMISSFIMMVIPLLVFITAGSSLIAGSNYFTVKKSVSLAAVWIVSVVVALSTSALQLEQVMQEVGPIEGRFDNNEFDLRWEQGRLQGTDERVQLDFF